MPRGRQKRMSAGRRHTPSTSSRRSRDRNVSHDAVYVTAVTGEESEPDVNNHVHDLLETSGALTHPRWDVNSPANGPRCFCIRLLKIGGLKCYRALKNPNFCGFIWTTWTLLYSPKLTDVISGATTWRIT